MKRVALGEPRSIRKANGAGERNRTVVNIRRVFFVGIY